MSSSAVPSSSNGNAVENTGGDIVIPNVSRIFEMRKNWIKNERQDAVQRYAQKSRRLNRILESNIQTDVWIQRTERLLSFLEHDFEISPRYKTEAQIDVLLKMIYDREDFHFPEPLKRRAKALYEEYEAQNWGQRGPDDVDSDDVDPEEGGDDEVLSNSQNMVAAHAANANPTIASIRQPPANHPIWGVNGIMHGVVPKHGGKNATTQLDRRYLREKRSAKVFGHNGLTPGDWFPNQLVALFHGAHGSRISGITGNIHTGAYSVVVSGLYKNVDEDRGDTIIYSGPGSQDNTDPDELPKGSAQALQTSLNSGRPVRVLRSSRGAISVAPSVGIRYDGLYVVSRRLAPQKNAKGGLFVCFVLQRIPGQESLESIYLRSPTRQQMADFSRIKEFF
ncbi:hypothetical protein M406DRAFT_327404 [Cryphonectria parasitica EP155]|uniref:YDG domain-containing protein n=1 Tax=Cryphonectria parasitica (strain ATCC 38755 / EP155) TaxID=660469 RepID=A0A9P5CTB8_CRYP1|nr:uncharacterized protein M406DRAFT_327404 [Cryphonectria parasitica EP155]KAF3768995.1 hypothetical protein M406DRAFT_327404 [Cryphonectria parasitica EP155]